MPIQTPEWYKRRRYLHFDQRINIETASAVVLEPEKVARHAFYPFLRYEKTKLRYKRCRTTGRLEKKPKVRPISYAAHLDSHIYGYYCELLSSAYESALSEQVCRDSVLAFRRLGKSNIGFAGQAFKAITTMQETEVTALDISDFFGSLNHRLLKESWAKVLALPQLPQDHYNVYKSITKFAYADRTDVYDAVGLPKNGRALASRICEPHEFRTAIRQAGLIHCNDKAAGIPQGSPLSALLSNIYMFDFDVVMHAEVTAAGGHYFRYCDDMLIISPSSAAARLRDLAHEQIKRLGLSIQGEKTEIRKFSRPDGTLRCDKPLQYLGFLFDGEKCRLRSSSLAKNSSRMNAAVRLAKATMRSRNALRLERGDSPTPLHLKALYRKHSYVGRRNFSSYGYRAARELQLEGLDARAINAQLKPLWVRLRAYIEQTA